MRKPSIDVNACLNAILPQSFFIENSIITKGIHATGYDVCARESSEAIWMQNSSEEKRVGVWFVAFFKS
jgi:hypothetical protein